MIDSLQQIIDSLKQTSQQNSTSDNIEVTIALLLLVSTAITIFFNWFLHRTSYKDDYYKKLISKRLDSYEKVEKFLTHFEKIEIEDSKQFYFAFKNINLYRQFWDDLIDIRDKTTWLSGDIIKEIYSLTDYIVENKLHFGVNDTVVTQLGIEVFEECFNSSERIKHLHYEDLSELYRIKKFLDDKK